MPGLGDPVGTPPGLTESSVLYPVNKDLGDLPLLGALRGPFKPLTRPTQSPGLLGLVETEDLTLEHQLVVGVVERVSMAVALLGEAGPLRRVVAGAAHPDLERERR
jgi:hypothetical protein